MHRRQWDIFCKVIDNFGDIGISWRLSADLAARGQQVRLWVDDASALAWMAPDGAASFSVAIRTLSVFGDDRIVLNVGGGVVQDSTADGEWEEALWKARYMQGLVRRA